jgi:uncharacterized membrane protein YgaE (UPF0421/DUF939 family)
LLQTVQNMLLRNSLKLFVAALLTAAIAVWTERIQFAWYPLLAVVMVVDDNDDHTLQAASGRILGTVAGGLITFLAHTILGGWIGVLVSMLVMIPVLQILGWQSALSTASLVAVMFLMLPGHTALGWDYVFNRALDTVVGCIVAILVGRLFWPQNSISELNAADGRLRRSLQNQLQAYSDWLAQRRSRPDPLNPAPLTNDLQRIEQLVAQERKGPRHQVLKRSGWEQRLRLWQLAHFHWIAWERLMAGLPEQQSLKADPLRHAVGELQRQLSEDPTPTPPRQPQRWQQLAQQLQLPLLPLLALAEEGRPLHACLGGLNRMAPL